MRLATFIRDNLEAILQEWESFARSVKTGQPALTAQGLRNYAEAILKTIAQDLLTPQTAKQQYDKSRGLGPVSDEDTAAQTHAVLRLNDGFSLDQLVSEYRALRASVLKLWLLQEQGSPALQLEDMMRFNEAIDQALGESITSYGNAVETTRKTVLAVLGHDLRSPLTAVLMGGELLHKSLPNPGRDRDIAAQITLSAQRANGMIHDLLDFARCNLGVGLPVEKALTDLSGICRSVVEEVRLGHPKARILIEGPDTLTGRFDPERIAQVFANLIINAVRYGDPDLPIFVGLKKAQNEVRFQVLNRGAPIPEKLLPNLFSPEGRICSYSDDPNGRSQGLGLGLFIAAQIVEGHGGRIEVNSTTDAGTCFEVMLPLS
ncbi:MAG: HAMP domain-containing histidine kinase [Pseudomonas putida]|jgi:signal transduction histidine kinase|nr:HAMP domain-containing histidine kinase [Pseudomonas putida]